jgi:hypothetical protein
LGGAHHKGHKAADYVRAVANKCRLFTVSEFYVLHIAEVLELFFFFFSVLNGGCSDERRAGAGADVVCGAM